MRTRLFFTALTIVSASLAGHCADPLFIAEGHFFKAFPKGAAMKKMVTVSTPGGSKAIGLVVSEPLSSDALNDTVPMADVKEGAELLRRFGEAVDRSDAAKTAKELRVGDMFPAFTATDIEGRTWTEKEVEGKVMVLNLWYTGCGPCRAEMPELSKWKDELPEVMFFSATYETPEVARQVLDKGTFNWTHLVGDKQFTEYIGHRGYPLTIVVGKDGRIADFEYGTSAEKRERLKSSLIDACSQSFAE